MFTKQRKNNIMYALIALLFSLILFFNANNATLQGNFITTNTYEDVLDEVTIQVLYDEDKFFIQGYQPTVEVALSSVNRIQLNTEMNEETRNFRVVADLTNLGPGTHDVPLRIEGISNSVSARIDPDVFTVTIENRVTQTFPVELDFTTDNLQVGFRLDTIVADPAEVTITTGDQTIKEIEKVVTDSSELQGITSNFSEELPVLAVNADGERMQAIIEPATVKLEGTVSAPEKQVGLYISQTGTVPANIAYFNFELSQTYATLAGPQDLIDAVTDIAIPVDITNVNAAVVQVLTIPTAEGTTLTPSQVSVNILPVYIETGGTSNDNESNNGGGTSPETSETPPADSEPTEESQQTEAEGITETSE